MNKQILAFLIVMLAAGVAEMATQVNALALGDPATTVAVVLKAAANGFITGCITAAARYGLTPVIGKKDPE